MGRVYLQVPLSDNGVKLGVVLHRYAMSATIFFVALLVGTGTGELTFDVLVQLAAQSHVDRLRTAADT